MASHDDVENGTSTQSAAMSLEKPQTDIKLTGMYTYIDHLSLFVSL